MALGIKIPFRLVDQYALQLIPGIGEELAAEIVYQRRVVCADLRARPSEVSKALTKVKGVGPVIARSLIATIDFSPLEGCKLH
jgi:ribosomal protein S13